MMKDDSNNNGTHKPPQKCRRASRQTAFFSLATTSDYFRETKFKPIKIIGILYLADPEPGIARLRAHSVDKLLQYPRFSSNVTLEKDEDGAKRVLFHRIPVDDIDIDYHFQVMDGNGVFSEEEHVSEMVSEAHLMDWDRSKPLWRIAVVKNMKDGRSMLFSIVDHTIGDGTAIAAIMASLFDKNTGAESSIALNNSNILNKKPIHSNKWRLSHRVLSYLYGWYYAVVGWVVFRADPDNCLKFSANNKRAKPKGKKCSQTKHYPLEEVKSLKNRLPGTTLNDIVTAVATIAMRRYYEQTQDGVLKGSRWRRPIHMTFTMNYRHPATTIDDLQVEGGSNRVVVGAFQVPLDFTSPIDAVWQCKARMDLYKQTPVVHIIWNASNFLIGCLPWRLLKEAALGAFFKPTGCISNIMGPSQRSSIGGYTIDDIAFYGTAPCQGFYLGIMSYNNRLRMFICIDKHVDADPDDFKECLEAAYDELKSAIERASPTELAPPDKTPLSAWILEWSLPVLLILVGMFAIDYSTTVAS